LLGCKLRFSLLPSTFLLVVLPFGIVLHIKRAALWPLLESFASSILLLTERRSAGSEEPALIKHGERGGGGMSRFQGIADR
jgi:hypothetical protein